MTNTVTTANPSSLYIRVKEICELLDISEPTAYRVVHKLNDELASQVLDISEPTAYRVVHKLNDELASQGYITFAGKTNRSYFMKKVCGHPLMEGGV